MHTILATASAYSLRLIRLVVHLNDPGKTAVGVAVRPDKSFRGLETAAYPASLLVSAPIVHGLNPRRGND